MFLKPYKITKLPMPSSGKKISFIKLQHFSISILNNYLTKTSTFFTSFSIDDQWQLHLNIKNLVYAQLFIVNNY